MKHHTPSRNTDSRQWPARTQSDMSHALPKSLCTERSDCVCGHRYKYPEFRILNAVQENASGQSTSIPRAWIVFLFDVNISYTLAGLYACTAYIDSNCCKSGVHSLRGEFVNRVLFSYFPQALHPKKNDISNDIRNPCATLVVYVL